MDSHSETKKRKRAPELSDTVTFSVAPAHSELGPVLGDLISDHQELSAYTLPTPFRMCIMGCALCLLSAVFPVPQPPPSTSFQLYREKEHLVQDGVEAHQIVKGSTHAVEYVSAAYSEDSKQDIASRSAGFRRHRPQSYAEFWGCRT